MAFIIIAVLVFLAAKQQLPVPNKPKDVPPVPQRLNESACTTAGARRLARVASLRRGAATYTFGLSAGASMAVQYHVAYSSSVLGAAVFAGKPYWCEKGSTRAVSHGQTDACLKHPSRVNVSSLVAYARQKAEAAAIDPIENLRSSNVFVYHGANDHTYLNGSMKNTADFYSALVGDEGSVTRHINEVFSDHAIPTDDFGSQCGGGPSDEGVESCGYDGAGAALQAVVREKLQPPDPAYDQSRLRTFDQRPFQRSSTEPTTWSNGLTATGLLYVPPLCDGGAASDAKSFSGCKLVLLFHGCYGYCSLDYVRHNGLLKHAATNKLVVLAPQVGSLYVGAGPANGTFQSCFDNYGDTGPDYCLKKGAQNVAVKRMVDCITTDVCP
jgi:poly(3-hydroxybutyrate) depolymerase